MEIKHEIRVDNKACTEPCLEHKHNNCKITKNLFNASLRCTIQTHNKMQMTASEKLKSEYVRKICKDKGKYNRYHINGLSSKSFILIKRMSHKDYFARKSVTEIAKYLDDNQLLFVSKKCMIIFVDLNFCLLEKYLHEVKLDENTNGKITDPVLFYKRGAKIFDDVRSVGLFNVVLEINYDASTSVYFDTSRHKFVDSIDTELRLNINSNKSNRDVLPARPISLDPVGYKRLNHNTNALYFCTTVAPFYRTIAQASDDVDKARSLHHNSGPSRQDISMDQYSFYEPNLTCIIPNQSAAQVSIQLNKTV